MLFQSRRIAQYAPYGDMIGNSNFVFIATPPPNRTG